MARIGEPLHCSRDGRRLHQARAAGPTTTVRYEPFLTGITRVRDRRGVHPGGSANGAEAPARHDRLPEPGAGPHRHERDAWWPRPLARLHRSEDLTEAELTCRSKTTTTTCGR